MELAKRNDCQYIIKTAQTRIYIQQATIKSEMLIPIKKMEYIWLEKNKRVLDITVRVCYHLNIAFETIMEESPYYLLSPVGLDLGR